MFQSSTQELMLSCGQWSGRKVEPRSKWDFRCENSLLFVRGLKPLLWNKQHYSDSHYHVSDKRLSSVFSQLNNCYWYFSMWMATLTLKAVIVFYVRPLPQLTVELSHWRGNQKKPTFKWGRRDGEVRKVFCLATLFVVVPSFFKGNRENIKVTAHVVKLMNFLSQMDSGSPFEISLHYYAHIYACPS